MFSVLRFIHRCSEEVSGAETCGKDVGLEAGPAALSRTARPRALLLIIIFVLLLPHQPEGAQNKK